MGSKLYIKRIGVWGMRDTGYWMLDAAYCLLPTAYRLLPTAYYLPSSVLKIIANKHNHTHGMWISTLY